MTRLCLVNITFHNRCRRTRSYFYLKSNLLQIAVLEAKIYKRIIEPQGFGRASWPAFNGPESCLSSYMPDWAILCSAAHPFIHPFQCSELYSFNLPFNSSIRSHQKQMWATCGYWQWALPPYCLPISPGRVSLIEKEPRLMHSCPFFFCLMCPPNHQRKGSTMGQNSRKSFLTLKPSCKYMDLGLPISRAVRNEIYFVYNPDTKSVYLLCLLGRLKVYSLSTLLHNRDTDWVK